MPERSDLNAMGGMPVRILCVDDERNVLRALERLFMDTEYEIVTCMSGEEGLKELESGLFQVVISDYRMPGINGVEFLKAVFVRWPETVRIVLSGYADAASIVSAINEGHIYRFIPKPWNDDELLLTIQSCLERYFLRKNNQELLEQLAVANQALEEKVQRRTEQLELRNRALQFSQNLLGNLPVGVVGIDENDMIAYCNDIAMRQLKNDCCDVFGASITSSCNVSVGTLVEQARREKTLTADITLGGRPCRVMACTMEFFESETVVMVISEV